MDVLEIELQEIILSKLPVDSLFRCRAVSKIWLGIIDDPSFRKTYQSKVRILSGLSAWQRWDTSHVFYRFVRDGRYAMAKKEVHTIEGDDIIAFSVRNYCYGLFYFDEFRFRLWGRRNGCGLVYNPYTKETLLTPPAPERKPYGRTRHVLGFDPLTRTSKLLDIYFEDGDKQKIGAATCSLKTGIWTICNASQRLSHPVEPSYISKVHATDTGNIYLWTGKNCRDNPDVTSPIRKPFGQVIVAFNMVREEFQSAWFPMRVDLMEIIEIGGKLVVCTAGEKYISTYTLVCYQTQEWTRSHRILRPFHQPWFDFCILSEKRIVLTYLRGEQRQGCVFERKEFYSLDLDTGKQIYLGQGRFDRSILVFGVRPNLIPLV